MKKIICFGLALLVLSISVLAGRYEQVIIPLEKKNPITWEIIEVKGRMISEVTEVNLPHKTGKRIIDYSQKVRVYASELEPKTSYTLIYYGDETHNDVWPYATCLITKTTRDNGNLYMVKNHIDIKKYLDDLIQEKFWLVLSSDVDCINGRMVAWHPEDYLFEHNTI